MKKQLTLLVLLLVNSSVALAATLSGHVQWSQQRELGIAISGIVKQLNVTSGQVVPAGTVLLALDCELYQQQLKQARAIFEGLGPALERAKKDQELADELFDRTVLSVVEHREAQLKYIEVKSKYEAASAALEQAQWKVNHCDLKAQDKIIVLSTRVSPGEMINLRAVQPALLRVASAEKMAISLEIETAALNGIKQGQKVQVILKDSNLVGMVAAINYDMQSAQSSSGDRRSDVTVEINGFNPSWLGQKAEVKF